MNARRLAKLSVSRAGWSVLLVCLVHSARADDQDCGNAPITVSTEKFADTKAAISGLAKGLLGIDGKLQIESKVTTVITQFPNADQVAIKLGAWIISCKTIAASTVSPAEKVKLYLATVKELVPPPADGLKVVNAPPVEKSRKAQISDIAPAAPKPARQKTSDDVALTAIAPTAGADGWALRYLPSYRQDSAHEYFVIVKSVTTADEGNAAIDKLRQHYPNYDFALYDHYNGSPFMGIMLAAWVTKSDAEKVLQIARSKIATDSYIWTF